jgi:hypothetical protein
MSYIDDEEIKIGISDEEEEDILEEVDSDENFNDLLDDDLDLAEEEGDELFSEEAKVLEETDI